MAEDIDINDAFSEFRDKLLREADSSGDPQHAVFFRLYAECAAENGDCPDLNYAPIIREGSRGYQVDGYSYDPDSGELNLAICDFYPENSLQNLTIDKVVQSFSRVKRFCEIAIDYEFIKTLEETSSTFELSWLMYNNREKISRIRCVLFTNSKLTTRKKTIEAGKVIGVDVVFNIIDFPRFNNIHLAQGGVEPIVLDVDELKGGILPCLEAHLLDSDYESYLVVMSGDLLARIYALYGARLMEQNVRTFLQAKTSANKGIINTLVEQPEMFFAYNNGITATASEVILAELGNGTKGIKSIKDLQIVNGGQTTASLLYAKDKLKTDLSKVFIQMKLSVVPVDRIEVVVPLISRFANTQNRISDADFFSSHPFHVEMQQISRRISVPAIAGALTSSRWFYERSRGQYKNEIMLRNPPERKKFEAEFPKSQVIVKTDLAKYYVTFSSQPHIVSLGAQKCFQYFAQEISRLWDTNKTSVNEAFFKDCISMSILFRELDTKIGKSEWYKSDRGYKANIVTYAIGWLIEFLKNENQTKIDLDLVWKNQSVPDDILDVLAEISQNIAKLLRTPPAGVTNISEYAKSVACWKRISNTSMAVDILKFKSIKEITNIKLSNDILEYGGKLSSASQMILDLSTWDEEMAKNIYFAAKEKHMLSPISGPALKKLIGNNKDLTISEKNAINHLVKKLAQIGFQQV